MRWRSTAGRAEPAGFETALFQGLAPDGGLYLPERWPELPSGFTDRPRPLPETGAVLMGLFLEEIPPADLEEIAGDALNFPIPLVQVGGGPRVLELFHGPTCAFKDVGARFMARLMAWYMQRSSTPITVLVATSGDTGSAVAHAFLGVPGTKVLILYPRGKVSPLQEKQFTTLGENVRTLAVEGTFDDCQRLAKAAFADEDLRARVRLTSANSINAGRLLPQAIYYVHAAANLASHEGAPRFGTPSGNFGNLCAGLIARRMGMPCAGFVAATNTNDVVPEYLETGDFRSRPSVETISNAMDVGNPSNLARIQDLYGGSVEAIRADVTGSRHDDDETREAIRRVHERTGYVLDPHTAVGWLALESVPKGTGPDVLLATAHPAKFREHVEPVIGRSVELPAALAACLEGESRSETIPAEGAAVREALLG